jgi:hypothetical protein
MVDEMTKVPASGSDGAKPGRGKLSTRVLDEASRFAIMFLYLWALFGVFVLEQRITLHQRGISVTWDGFALINALVLAKVMLVVEDLDVGRWLPRRPLIWPILHDAMLLSLLFIGFHFLEDKVVAWFKGVDTGDSHPLGGGGIEGFLSVAALLFISLIPFFAFRHFSRVLGGDRLRAILFRKEGGESGYR